MAIAFWISISLNCIAIIFLIVSAKQQNKIYESLQQEKEIKQDLIEFILDSDENQTSTLKDSA